jgi:hypothetical protein
MYPYPERIWIRSFAEKYGSFAGIEAPYKKISVGVHFVRAPRKILLN